ncbi:hypothetical protein LTR28_010204 [Elasticomyces elasticus]|nr:hypothetical protein LTR28_010204 [Elasticomyces elasticus]
MVITRQSSFDTALDKVNNVVEKGSLKLRKASADLVKVAERLVPRKDSAAKPQEIPTSPADFLATNSPRRPYVPGGRPNEDELRAARHARDRLAAQRARAETEVGPLPPRPAKPNTAARGKFTEEGLSPPRAPQSGDLRSTMRVRSRPPTSPPPKDRVSAAVDTVVEGASHMLRHKVSDESFFDQSSSVPGHMELCRICGEDTVFGWDGYEFVEFQNMATSTRARSPSPPARDLIELAEKATKSYFDNGRHNAGYEGYRQRAKDVTDPLADKTAADKRLKRSTSFRKSGAAARRSLGSIGVGLQKLGTKLEGWSSRPGSPAPTTPTSYAESLRSEEGHPKRYSKTMQDAVTKAKEEQERMDFRISAGHDYFDNHQLVDAPPQVVLELAESLFSKKRWNQYLVLFIYVLRKLSEKFQTPGRGSITTQSILGRADPKCALIRSHTQITRKSALQ